MTRFPSRYMVLTLGLIAGAGVVPLLRPAGQSANFLASAAAQTADASPAPTAGAADAAAATDMVNTSGNKGPHLAPHDTFYVLSYVAARTNDGVEGFDPGQEVRLVEVHRATHTLVVTDGHAQVEVSPDKLTNDMDIAALARQKDEASQARVAAHLRTEQEAYDKREREAADATAKDLAQRREAQKQQNAEVDRQEHPPVAQTAASAPDASNNDGYYGYGGFGYGNPYSYFVGPVGNNVPSGSAGAAPAAGARSGASGTAPRANPSSVGTAGAARPTH